MQTPTHFWNRSRRPLIAGFTALAMLVLLFVPPVRAAAGQLLQVFRVQKVMFIPTSLDRIQQLEQSGFDPSNLFMAEPELVNSPAAPQTVASAAEASDAAGFAVQEPQQLPSAATSKSFVVNDRRVVQLQVNVAAARELLGLMGVNDVQIPDALGAQPIVADVAQTVESSYEGPRYRLELLQGRSPDVNLPEGVDLAQLGKAGLRLLGMDPVQAEALAAQIDWSSTFVFPFPANLDEVRQVPVGDVDGVLVKGDGEGDEERWHLYWQRGDRFYVLNGEGFINEGEMMAVAESVR